MKRQQIFDIFKSTMKAIEIIKETLKRIENSNTLLRYTCNKYIDFRLETLKRTEFKEKYFNSIFERVDCKILSRIYDTNR